MINLKVVSTFVLLACTGQSSYAFLSSTQNAFSTYKQSKLYMSSSGNTVVISPPGGIGEVVVYSAAKMGSSVRWFVISPSSSTSTITLSPEIAGDIQVASAEANTLLLAKDDPSSAISAVSTWCSNADGVICVVDGVEQAIQALSNGNDGQKVLDFSEKEKLKNEMFNAIKVAAKEASSVASTSGMKIAVVPADMDNEIEEEQSEKSGFLDGILGGSKVEVPSSMISALGSNNVATLRYGDLFGIPETSTDASPFVGGPRKYPVLRDEYTMKGIRMDPSKTASGNSMLGESSRSSRLSVGEAAARMAIDSESLNVSNGIDICLTSLRGSEDLDAEDWETEFTRVCEAVKKSSGGELFNASFGSVPSEERLADWLAMKWAPAVLKTYDIAGIRVGARPVYASRFGDSQVEIIWQELKDFKTTTVGKMIIEITKNGMVAKRQAGDARAGFGTVSSVPLPGEDILVRRLSDAASQAMEKGLATKPAPSKRIKKKVEEAPVKSTVLSSGVIETQAPVASEPSSSSETGPRSAGARRSSERKRGRRRSD